VDFHARLTVAAVEKSRTCGWNGRVALDETGEHAASVFNPQRERVHVEQEDVLDVALEHAALDAGADGDDLIRVDALSAAVC